MPQPKSSLKVLHLVLSIGATSSPYNEHCLPWANELDISICTYFRPAIKPPQNIKLFAGNGSLIGFFNMLKIALQESDLDVIHAHSPHVGFLFLLARILFFNRTPPAIITVHDSYPNFKLRNRLLLLPVFATFHRVICCSRSSLKSFPPIYKRLAGNRLDFVQNGLDIVRVDRILTKNKVPPHQPDNFTIVAISRLVSIKNPFTILTAFLSSLNQNCRLVYIGDGPLRPKLLAHKQKLDFDNQIEFTGLIPREKVFEQLQNADLFISASRGEGLPVSVLEAMSCRCPVLLSDIPPHREIAEYANFIPLIHPDDTAGFSREMQKFCAMPASERTSIGENCRQLVEAQFSLQTMHTQYLKIYAQVAQKRLGARLEVVG